MVQLQRLLLLIIATLQGLTDALKCYFCSGKDDCSTGVCEATTACWQQVLPRAEGGYRVDKLCGNHDPTFIDDLGEGCHSIPSVYTEVIFCKCNSSDYCNNARYMSRFPEFYATVPRGRSGQFPPPSEQTRTPVSVQKDQGYDDSVKCYSCQRTGETDCRENQCTGAWCIQETKMTTSGRVLSIYKNCSQLNELTDERETCVETESTNPPGIVLQRCGCRSRDFCNSPRFMETLPRRSLSERSFQGQRSTAAASSINHAFDLLPQRHQSRLLFVTKIASILLICALHICAFA